ncbi:MAG TPA: tetratricopeptide repeat protein, partial [Anaeromyxobacteraceae bacterium]|nr:tetratricopeptide repeat protein [Anaeromyxobacteraceae bacterium]
IAGMGDAVVAGDAELQRLLDEGNERLAAADAEGARDALRRAAARRPADLGQLGLLGHACYRAGLFEEAAEAYGRIVDDSPAEVPARVNLGLAWLKAGRHPEAVRQFQIALDLDPEHRKSMGYLGLALLESGDPRAARPWLERSGSTGLLARCDAMIAGAEAPRVAVTTPQPAPVVAAPVAAVPVPAAPVAIPVPATPVLTPVPPPPPSPAGHATVTPIRPSPTPIAMRAAVPLGGLGAFAAERTVRPPPEVFALENGILHVAVRGELVCRVEGLFAVRGSVSAVPEMKRFRGKLTEKPFGAGRDRMNRMSGEGALFYRTGGWVFTTVDLAGDAGYFREESVFALEEAVLFENGRVPSRHGRDLDLVHLRGRGRILLRTTAAPVAIEIAGTEVLKVPPASLVGWTGSVTPRIGLLSGNDAAAASAPAGSPVVVELTGEGRVLVDPDAAPAD